MNGLQQEIRTFLARKELREADARQLAAMQIACHFDLCEALQADAPRRALIVLRLERMIERERQRGQRRHWSYDLNRHIALKQALDRLSPGRQTAQRDLETSGPEIRKRRQRRRFENTSG